MTTLNFTSVMKIYNGNPYIHVSAEQATLLKPGWRRPMPVLIRINGKPTSAWQINMMPMGNGDFYLYLHGDVRKASNTKVDDIVNVELKFDSAYRTGPIHPMPLWFSTALKKNQEAKKNWELLIPSRKKEILRYFSWLKSQEAIDRNLKRALNVLSGKPGRFMARSWNEGS